MTMEHFAYPWMNAFFGEKADDYRYAHLMSALEVIPYMVCVDEFQHKVFENIGMTAKERRAIWHQLELTYMPWRNYDGHKFLEEGGFWMQKQHIFVNPFYYIAAGYRDSMLTGDWFYMRPTLTVYFWGVTIVMMLVGLKVFKKLRPHFSDVL